MSVSGDAEGLVLQLADPPGCRSCGSGGEWEQVRDAVPWAAELDAVKFIARSDHDFRLLRREVMKFVELAARGDLEYGKRDDVYRMDLAPLVLELRFSQRVEYPDGVRAVRLYFSEPAHEDGVLLAAKLAAKPATKDGLGLQDEHIVEAELRIKTHYGL